MTKITLANLSSLQNENSALTVINGNADILETAFDNTLSRDGTSPNQMGSNLDMNSYHILNLPEPSSDADPIRKIDLTNVSNVTNVLHTASSSSITIGTGSKTFTVPSGLGFFSGQYVLIQNSLNSSQYMLGRVTSYTGTSLVVNVLTTAGSGTFSTWAIDLSGPQGPQSVVYDTVTNASAASIDPTISFLGLSGYTAVGDGGNGLYKRQVSQPSDFGRFQSADGNWWHLISPSVTPEMFNCKGDGTTDDRANFQNALDFLDARGGGTIVCTTGKTYRIVLSGSNIGLIIRDKVTLQVNGATINMECDGGALGMRMRSNTTAVGPGTVAVTSSTNIGGTQAMYHATITIGELNGNDGTPGSISAFTNMHDITIRGLTLTNARTNFGSIIQGYGGCYNITIEKNTFPDSTGAGLAIGFDWAYLGVLSSANINLSRTNYNAGTAYSIHPHDVRIMDNIIGVFSASYPEGSTAIRTSGVYNFLIKGNDIQSTRYSGIFCTGGDLSFEFAPTEVRHQALKNIIVESNILHQCNTGFGIFWDGFPDNVYDAFSNPANPSFPYSTIYYPDGYTTPTSAIRGNTISATGTLGLGTSAAIHVRFTRGLSIEKNVILGDANAPLYGVRLDDGSRNVNISDNNISLTSNSGIYINGSTVEIENLLIKHNWVWRCGNTDVHSNIYVNWGNNVVIDGNYVGSQDEDQALNGINIASGAFRVSLINNFVYEVKTGGTAYALPSGAAALASIWVFRDNYYNNGSNTYLSGPTILPVRREYSVASPGLVVTHAEAQRGSLSSDLTPSFGQWNLGSTILNIDATNTGQVALTKCVASGSPGTWKAMSTLP